MRSLTTASIHSSSLFWTVFDVPLKTVAFLRCSSNTSSNCATKSTNQRKIPGLVEPSVSSLPRRANSRTPQNLTHWMSRFKMCRFLFTSSLWRRTASLYPSSSWVAMFTLPKPQNFRQLSMCSFACSCFFYLFGQMVHVLNSGCCPCSAVCHGAFWGGKGGRDSKRLC